MKIRKISAYQADLPLAEGPYNWSGRNTVAIFDSTIVRIDTDEGLSGFGEVCPLGPLNDVMDAALKGHPYVKSPLDVACWDIFGQAAGLPLCEMLGGRHGDDFVLYRAISQESPERMAELVSMHREAGYTRFQLKVGSDTATDIRRIEQAAGLLGDGERLVADANTGWLAHDALRVVRAVRDVDVYIEQPCASYEECLAVRRSTDHPFVLDESIDSVRALLRAAGDRALDVANLKISKLGGLTKARQMRDLCLSLGIGMTIEDTWGGDFATATIAHLAHSTPPQALFSSTDFNSYVTVSTARNPPRRAGGRLAAPRNRGLGLQPDMAVLGEPVLVVE